MDGIVAILEERYFQAVREIWQRLGSECQVTGMQRSWAASSVTASAAAGWSAELDNAAAALPHFSWHVAESYDEEPLRQALAQICAEAQPFTARTAGLGFFIAPKPVLYISLVKDRALMKFHERLWALLGDLAWQASPFYTPDAWMPHITLAYEDLSQEQAACCLKQLLSEPLQWELRVDNLALIGEATRWAPAQAGTVNPQEFQEGCFKFYFGKGA